MVDANEILVTADASGQVWNMCFWDFSTGTSLRTIKGGVSAPRTLSVISNDYVISAEKNKPIINVWPLQNKDNVPMKIVSPGRITALIVTPDGLFCIGAASEKLHVWQISTGDLIFVTTRHYQPITCLKTTDDGSFVISAGEDNLVFVWKLQKKLISVYKSRTSTADCAPHYSWAHHTLPVTDVHVGKGGRRARVVTVSLDHSCRLYSLQTGVLLITFVMDISLTSTIMDWAEYQLFTGSSDGRIFEINLLERLKTPEHCFSKEDSNVFHGHSKAVSALAVTLDCQILISGSFDELVKIWNVPSRQCLRSLSHKGPITNIMLIPAINMASLIGSSKTLQPIRPFLSFLCGTDNLEGTWEHKASVTLPHVEETFSDASEVLKQLYNEDSVSVRELILKVEQLEKCNNELYLKAAEQILNS